MKTSYKIVTTKVFIQSLARLSSFLTRKYSNQFSKKQINIIKQAIADKLVETPFIAPPSERLLDLGVYQCRQWSIDNHNLLFYRVDEVNEQIILLAIIDSRQNIEKLLYEIVLLS